MSEDDSQFSDDDKAVWAYEMRGVKPLDGKKKPLSAKQPTVNVTSRKGTPKREQLSRKEITSSLAPTSNKEMHAGFGVDRRTLERFRKGQMPIEGVIDLHGFTREQARASLQRFLLHAHATQKRCILVITGKGQKGRDPLAAHEGVIKNAFIDWVREVTLSDIVLRPHLAKPKDGGSGAFYVLLRRLRS